MVLRIRLARFGSKRKPVYNIVLSQAKTARNSKPMEVLGTYNPIPQEPPASRDTPEFTPEGEKFKPKKYKDIKLDTARTKYWLGVGAQPSEPVEKLLFMVSFFGITLVPGEDRWKTRRERDSRRFVPRWDGLALAASHCGEACWKDRLPLSSANHRAL